MISKIVSGGQTGADQAALDVAVDMGIPHGGWIPKGRKTEDGPLPETYELRESETPGYAERTERNVMDSDGTLIVSHGPLSGGSAYTLQCAEEHRRPCLHIDLRASGAFGAAEAVKDWIKQEKIRVLNVAGPRASEDPAIYEAVTKLLKSALFLDIVERNMSDPYRNIPNRPQTIEEAVDELASILPLRDRAVIAKMDRQALVQLHPDLGQFIRTRFGLTSGNEALMNACRYLAKTYDLDAEAASELIIRELWHALQRTHTLRVVK